jgi:hypothetical protein
MTQVTVQQLKELDPRAYQKAYEKWASEDHYYFDTDWVKESYEIKYKGNGIDIDELHYRISYSQGDYASFTGRVFVATWMETVECATGQTYAERYPALFLACQDDGSYMNITGEDERRGWRVDYRESHFNTYPQGIFQNLSEEAWDELLQEQASDADLETEIREYCERIGREMYRELQQHYEEISSEESFEAYCEWNDVTFEVEE